MAIIATGVQSPILDTLAVILIVARVLQTLIHISLKQTDLVAGIRFAFYFVQFICMFTMGVFVAANV